MFDPTRLGIFIVASLVLLVTPGPAVLYIVARSIHQGRLAGIISVLGIGTGALFHVAGAVLGLSALLASSATAFSVVKYLGAVYLIYLGIKSIRSKEEKTQIHLSSQIKPQKLSLIFRQGVIVNLLNPKTALFFLAFLPQFANGSHGTIGLQIFLLGMIFVVLGICSDSMYALVSGSLGVWLKQRPGFFRVQHRVSGGIYITLGLVTAFSGSNKT